jgi:hypothetical protein
MLSDHPGGPFYYITDHCNIDAIEEYADEHDEGLLRVVILQVGTCSVAMICAAEAVYDCGSTSGSSPISVPPVWSYMRRIDDDEA